MNTLTERDIQKYEKKEYDVLEEMIVYSEYDPDTGTLHIPECFRMRFELIKKLMEARVERNGAA